MSARRLLLLAAVLPVAAVGAWLLIGPDGDGSPPGPRYPSPRRPLLPNLVMAPLADVRVAWDDHGGRQILFSATIANVGDGPFVVHAQRAPGESRWLVTQRFREPDGTTSERPVPEARMVWGGHGHDHWHVQLGASYRLVRSDDGDGIRILRKAGFCFFDRLHDRRRAARTPAAPVFSARGCNGTESTDLDMGLSVGWADPYYWTLPDQRLDVTGLAPGVYRLVARADPDGWFRETTEDDNEAWVDVRLGDRADGTPTLVVLGRSGRPGRPHPRRSGDAAYDEPDGRGSDTRADVRG